MKNLELGTKQVVLILGVFLVAVFAPFLFLEKIFLDGDTIMYTYPIAFFLKTHAGSLINAFSFGGYPIDVAFHIGYFNPLYRLFFKIFDFLFAYHFILFIDFCAAAFFTYVFVRALKVSVYGALLSTLAFVFGQWALFWMSSINIAHALYLLPALLFCTIKITESAHRVGYVVLFALVLGLAFLSTHYQYIMLALIASGLFLLYCLWKKWKREEGVLKNMIPFFLFVAACIVGFGFGSIQLLHTAHFLPFSMRATSSAFQSVWYSDLLRYLIPSFELPRLSTQEFFPYIGIVPLFFAIIAFVKVRKEAWGTYGKFFVWAFGLCLILTLKYSPLFWVLRHLPLGQYFAQSARWLYIGNFSLAVMAAFGFDYVRAHPEMLASAKVRACSKRIMCALIGLIIFANLLYVAFGKQLLLFVQKYFDAHMYANTIHLPLAYYHTLITVTTDKIFYNFSLLNPNILLLIVSLLLLYRLYYFVEKKILFSNAVIAVTVLNLLVFAFIGLKIGNRDLLVQKPFIAEAIALKEKSPYDYRVFSYLIPFAQYQKIAALHPEAVEEGFVFAREALVGNLHLFSDTPIVGGYEPIAPRRYQKLLFYLENAPDHETIEQKTNDLISRLPLLGMMNGKYIVSPYELKSDRLIFATSTAVTRFNVPLYLYENKESMPRYYFAKNISYIDENTEDASYEKVTTFKDFKNATVIECSDCSHAYVPTNVDNDSVSVVAQTGSVVSLSTSNLSPRWLIVSVAGVPGWTARVDGFRVKIYYANHAFQAIMVPSGKHTVVFSYN